ncbi:MAG: GNAT family N-acetyltransferase [Pseudolabrys sp.]
MLRDGTRVLIRPLRPDDAALYPDFVATLTPEDIRLRMFAPLVVLSKALLDRLTRFDRAHAFALIALDEATGKMLGVVRLHNDPGGKTGELAGEFAVMVQSRLKGQGLGWMLMQRMIATARQRGIHTVHGQVLRENVTMLAMCRELGFAVSDDPDDTSVELVRLNVDAAA